MSNGTTTAPWYQSILDFFKGIFSSPQFQTLMSGLLQMLLTALMGLFGAAAAAAKLTEGVTAAERVSMNLSNDPVRSLMAVMLLVRGKVQGSGVTLTPQMETDFEMALSALDAIQPGTMQAIYCKDLLMKDVGLDNSSASMCAITGYANGVVKTAAFQAAMKAAAAKP